MFELVFDLWHVAAGIVAIMIISLRIVITLLTNIWQCLLALKKIAIGITHIVQFFLCNCTAEC